jgi:hypothetical protein
LHFTFFLHEPMPEHVTSHGAIPHWTSSAQASKPLHSTVHDDAIPQTTRRSHDRSPQTTLHGTFGGHVTSCAQVSEPLQSITQTPATQVPFEQPCSHRVSRASTEDGPSGITPVQLAPPEHQPSTQPCPPPQSAALAHATVQSRSDGE